MVSRVCRLEELVAVDLLWWLLIGAAANGFGGAAKKLTEREHALIGDVQLSSWSRRGDELICSFIGKEVAP